MKYLIVLVVVLVVFWLWRSGRDALGTARRDAARDAAVASRKPPAQLEMVRCQVCGVHLPEADAVRADAAYYCSVEHLNQAHGRDGSG